jgi:diguanylate cyclase (GGDEF)-like protein
VRAALIGSLLLVVLVLSFVWLFTLNISADETELNIFIAEYAIATVISALALFVGYSSFSTAHKLAMSEALSSRLAGHDTLSGLPNRMLFSQNIDHILARDSRQNTGAALFYIDLDRFKEINDTLGHDAGDAVIIAVGARIRSVMRSCDFSARFGGDEFALFLDNIRSVRDCEMIARRLLESIRAPLNLRGIKIGIGASIGIAMSPGDASDRETLMRLADLALYRAKKDGRNRFAFFEPSMDENLRRRKAAENELRRAIDNHEIAVSYQPIYNAGGEDIVAVEALARWNHPTRGAIPPDHFIRLAEERNLIIPLGEWVLRRACLDAKAWPTIRLGVNVSAVQFRNRSFVARILKILTDTDFDPHRLELEVTETVVVENIAQTEAAISQLRDIGIRLALDDFGTGYSSMIYLRRFDFDKIKIDRMFLQSVSSAQDRALLNSIAHLGNALGMTVTAEGVETKEQHQLLRELGYDEMQGYLFSRPVSASEISALLNAQHQRHAAAARPHQHLSASL